MTTPVSSSTGTSSSLTSSAAKELSDRFLTMLTAQMKNQDPLNPLDNAELTSQLAQINTVTGISQLNETMQWLGYSMASLQSTQAASGMIGRNVLVPGTELALKDGKASGGYALSLGVEQAQLIVKDELGNAVRTVRLEGITTGVHQFEWDGKDATGRTLPDGTYTFEISVTAGDQVGTAPGLVATQVAAVRPYAGGTTVLDTAGKAINLNDVYQVW